VKEKDDSILSLSKVLSKAESELVLSKESQSGLETSLNEQTKTVNLLQDNYHAKELTHSKDLSAKVGSINKLSEKLKSAEALINTMESQINEKDARYETAEQELQIAKRRAEVKEALIVSLEEGSQKQLMKIQDMSKLLGSQEKLKKVNQRLENILAENISEIKKLKDTIAVAKQSTKETNLKYHELEGLLNEKKQEVRTVTQKLNAMAVKETKIKEEIISELDLAKQTITNLRVELNTTAEELQRSQVRVKKMEKESSLRDDTISRLTKNVVEHEQYSKTLESKRDYITKEYETVTHTLVEKVALVSRLENDIHATNERLQISESSINENAKQTEAKLKKLESKINERDAHIRTVEWELQMARKKLEFESFEHQKNIKEKDIILTSLEELVAKMETSIEDKDDKLVSRQIEVDNLKNRVEEMEIEIEKLNMNQKISKAKKTRNQVIDSDEESIYGILDNEPPDIGANGVEIPPLDFQLGC
jgi:chromosome segregation ATPase